MKSISWSRLNRKVHYWEAAVCGLPVLIVILGVIIGVTLPALVEHFADMKTIVTPGAVLVSFGISGLIGIVAGIYPASSAASLDPIEALRHE